MKIRAQYINNKLIIHHLKNCLLTSSTYILLIYRISLFSKALNCDDEQFSIKCFSLKKDYNLING